MNNDVFLSIIIPALNEEVYLPKLLESLSHQTDDRFEVIVADGKSSDKTVARAKRFSKKLPHLEVATCPHRGLPKQRNYGASIAKGNWLAFIDADSIVMPYFVERCKSYIYDHSPQLFTSWSRPDSEVSGDALLTLIANVSIEMSIILKRPHAPGPLTVVSREAFDRVKGYDENANYLEDYDFSMRLHRVGIDLAISRETFYVWSLRRLRDKGTIKFAQTYAKGALSVLINKPLRDMPGYVMGGQIYGNSKKEETTSRIALFNRKVMHVLKELFE